MPRRRRSKGVAARLSALNRLLKAKRQRSELETGCIHRAITDLENEKQNGLIWNEAEAVRAVQFCALLRHWQGPCQGQPFKLQPWQEQLIVAPLFGWFREHDGRRRFTESYIEVPRKNGKSFLAAAIALQGLLADRESGPEVYVVATKFDQAMIVFRDAVNSMRQNPQLQKLVTTFKQSLLCPGNSGFLKPICGNPDTIHGLKASRVIADELHSHKTREVYDVVASSRGARSQPLVVGITTAGHDRSSICWELHQRSASVLNRSSSHESFHCFVACADSGDDFRDPRIWRKANPNLGISIKRDYLEEEAEKAFESPAAENTFRNLHLNQWTEQAVRWIPMHAWDECVGDVDARELIGEECYAALDCGNTRDPNALVLAFPRPDGRVALLPFFWIPGESESKRAEQDRAQLLRWAEKGFIRRTSGTTADVDGQIPADILDICELYRVKMLAYDSWGPGEAVIQKLVNGGFPFKKVVKFRQTMANFAAATKEFERLVLSRKLEHGGNPVMRWMASNVAVKTDPSGNYRPDKENSADKIDGIVAAIMGVGLLLTQQQAPVPTFYNTHELESF